MDVYSVMKTFLLNISKVTVTLIMVGQLASCSTVTDSDKAYRTANGGQELQFASAIEFNVDPNTIYSQTTNDVFKPGDTAIISVFNVDNLSNEYVVSRSGSLNLPLIGAVNVAGYSTLDVQEDLVSLYGDNYLENPSISVQIEQREIGKVIVDGSVASPGVFDMTDVITLSEAVALAGGLDDEANASKIFISRNVGGVRRVRQVDYNQVRLSEDADLKIVPNDIIFVDKSLGRVAFTEFLKTVPLLNTAAILAVR